MKTAPIDIPYYNRPLAAQGLISYRAKGRYGYIMIGAKDHEDAMKEAQRSTDKPTDLRVWDGTRYIPILLTNALHRLK